MPYKIEDGVTQSMLMDWLGCRQRSLYILDGWEKGGTSEALEFGNSIHRALQVHYEGESCSDILEAIYSSQDIAQIDAQMMEDVFAKAEAVFPQYVEYWKKDDKKLKWKSLEPVFDVKWKGFRLRGRCDGVFLRAKGQHWLLETKTKGRISEDTLNDALGFDFQNLFYIVAKQKELGRRIHGVLYNIIRNPGLKKNKAGDRKEWKERIIADVAKKPDHYFKRFEIVYPKEVVERFEGELLLKLVEFRQWLEGGVPTYRSECSCVGRWNCEFLQACGSDTMTGYTETRELFRELKD